ncbi:MAG TPA: VOC family protein [Castellaniella sp.]|uniref:VOC family protein n=1 Tax=Castellaniella sp. TaxID=1955812 RepID=UPI002EFC68F6
MAILGIHHLGLSVRDLDKTTAFFTECLGWKVVREVPDYPAKFVSNGSAFFTLWQTDPGATSFDRRKNLGLHHVALQVSDETDLDALYTKLQAYPGVEIEFSPQPVAGGPAKHCIFREPSGIRMEFFWAP